VESLRCAAGPIQAVLHPIPRVSVTPTSPPENFVHPGITKRNSPVFGEFPSFVFLYIDRGILALGYLDFPLQDAQSVRSLLGHAFSNLWAWRVHFPSRMQSGMRDSHSVGRSVSWTRVTIEISGPG
jgi:hypothetical protein